MAKAVATSRRNNDIAMAGIGVDPSSHFKRPANRVVEVGEQVPIWAPLQRFALTTWKNPSSSFSLLPRSVRYRIVLTLHQSQSR